MAVWSSVEDRERIEAEASWESRELPASVHAMLSATARRHGDAKAITYQLTSGPGDPAETLTWAELLAETNRAANLLRSLGIGEGDAVALLMPNATETVAAILGGMTAGIVNPINPLLEVDQIAAILQATNAKALITLKSFPRTDLAQKAAAALEQAPGVETLIEVDLKRYLTPPRSWLVPLIRPKVEARHRARVIGWTKAVAEQPSELTFAPGTGDRIGAYFHTGGTTGHPKIVQHAQSGMVYNGWVGDTLLFDVSSVTMCPLPLFHVFATQVILMAGVASGAHTVFPTPQGYRGDGVFDNFWKLVERHRATFLITVPTAVSALMQRKIDADVSTLRYAFSGSAPMPKELFRRFTNATGLTIIEGYGLTEATCLVSCNPKDGDGQKIGSVGIPFPYTDVRIFHCDENGAIAKQCEADEVGEICVDNPGVLHGRTYTDENKNRGLYAGNRHLRTGDLGRLDPDGYLWITGRKKDLIIRGGHNVDPAVIEEALSDHEQVAMAGAIGQPDAHSGEIPCAYVELVQGATITGDELRDWAHERIGERAARPRVVEVLDELPKTAVGKVFKPDLRKRAIARVFGDALRENNIAAEVVDVVDDRRRGLTARIARRGEVDEDRVGKILGAFARPWEWDA